MVDLIEQRKEVVNALDRMEGQIAGMVSELVAIPSVNPNYPGCVYEDHLGGETAANKALAEFYRDSGLDVSWVERVEGRANLVGRLPGSGGDKAKSLVVCGHIDVVPPGDLDDWKTGEPFVPTVLDGKIYGRGTSDMKGGLVAAVLGVAALREAGVQLRGDLTLQSVVGEETGDHDVGVQAVIDEGFVGDAAIVAESTNHVVAPISGGLLWMTLRIRGKAGHNNLRGELIHAGGRGEDAGVNALEKGVYLVGMIQELERQWGQTKGHPFFKPGWFSLLPGVMVAAPKGIMVPFMISTYCNIDYSILYPPNESSESIQREIEDFILQASKLDPWLNKNPPEIEWRLDWPPFQTDPGHPIVVATADAYRLAAGTAANGAPARVTGYGAVCDASFFSAAGIPTVVYGGGPPQGGHKADEFTEIRRVLLAAKTYALTAMEWCGVT